MEVWLQITLAVYAIIGILVFAFHCSPGWDPYEAVAKSLLWPLIFVVELSLALYYVLMKTFRL